MGSPIPQVNRPPPRTTNDFRAFLRHGHCSHVLHMSGVWSDLRHGIRILFAKPTASLIAILTLALGIGAATAVFSVVDAVLLRPLPYPEANRLVFLWSTFKVGGGDRSGSALPNYREWRDRNHSFSGLGGYYPNDMSLAAGTGQPEQRGQVLVVERSTLLADRRCLPGAVVVPKGGEEVFDE